MQAFENVCFFQEMLNAAVKKCATFLFTSFMSHFYSFDFLTFSFKIRSRAHLLNKTEYFLCVYTELHLFFILFIFINISISHWRSSIVLVDRCSQEEDREVMLENLRRHLKRPAKELLPPKTRNKGEDEGTALSDTRTSHFYRPPRWGVTAPDRCFVSLRAARFGHCGGHFPWKAQRNPTPNMEKRLGMLRQICWPPPPLCEPEVT